MQVTNLNPPPQTKELSWILLAGPTGNQGSLLNGEEGHGTAGVTVMRRDQDLTVAGSEDGGSGQEQGLQAALGAGGRPGHDPERQESTATPKVCPRAFGTQESPADTPVSALRHPFWTRDRNRKMTNPCE